MSHCEIYNKICTIKGCMCSVRFCVGVAYSSHNKQPHTALTPFHSGKPIVFEGLHGMSKEGTTQSQNAVIQSKPTPTCMLTDMHAPDTLRGRINTVQRKACSFMHAGFGGCRGDSLCFHRGFINRSKDHGSHRFLSDWNTK